jgi:hypothetical protein
MFSSTYSRLDLSSGQPKTNNQNVNTDHAVTAVSKVAAAPFNDVFK